MGSKKNKDKNRKSSKNEKIKFSKKHPKLSITLKIGLLVIVLIAVIGLGIVIGMLYGAWGNEFEITQEELIVGSSNSKVLDKDEIKLAELSGDENRKIIKLDQMPQYLKDALCCNRR